MTLDRVKQIYPKYRYVVCVYNVYEYTILRTWSNTGSLLIIHTLTRWLFYNMCVRVRIYTIVYLRIPTRHEYITPRVSKTRAYSYKDELFSIFRLWILQCIMHVGVCTHCIVRLHSKYANLKINSLVDIVLRVVVGVN